MFVVLFFSHRKHSVANSFKSEDENAAFETADPHPKQKVEPRAIWPADLRVRSSSERADAASCVTDRCRADKGMIFPSQVFLMIPPDLTRRTNVELLPF